VFCVSVFAELEWTRLISNWQVLKKKKRCSRSKKNETKRRKNEKNRKKLKRSRQPIFCFFVYVYLEYSQQTLIETVKVSSWLFSQRVIVKSCSKHLHPQQCKDAHEQKEEKQQWGNGLNTVRERSHQIGKGLPIPVNKSRGHLVSALYERLVCKYPDLHFANNILYNYIQWNDTHQ
jgi:hypothetical protein